MTKLYLVPGETQIFHYPFRSPPYVATCVTCKTDAGVLWQRSYRTSDQATISLHQHHYDNHPETVTARAWRRHLGELWGVVTIPIAPGSISTEAFELITGKDTMTTTSTIQEIDEELASLRRQREKLQSKRSKVDAEYEELNRELDNLLVRRRRALIPEEPGPNGTVIRFTLVLPVGTSERSYDYAAVRSGGRWFRTGGTAPSRGETWQELVRYIQNANLNSGVFVLTHDKHVVIPPRD